jgi:phage tail-like protein
VTRGPCGPRLLRRAPCSPAFEPVWPEGCGYPLADPVAVAALRHEVAVSDAGTGRVWAWSNGGAVPRASIPVDAPGAIAFTPSGGLLVAVDATTTVLRFTPSGDPVTQTRIDARGAIRKLAVASDCAVWAAVCDDHDYVRLYRLDHAGGDWEEQSLERAQRDLPGSGVALVTLEGFCLADPTPAGEPVRRCYDWCGLPLETLSDSAAAPVEPRGQLITGAIDSGMPGCRWHRVRVDADVPAGTGVAVAVAVADTDPAPDLGDAAHDPLWQDFEPGLPHPDDWQSAPAGSLDFLVDQPAGRYLFVRLRLTGQGPATPVVRRVRLDFPRVTSFDHVPAVYHQSPEVEDFGERFTSLFDASIEDLDRAVDRHPALLDVDGVPPEALPWIGGFLELAAEPWWGPDRYRGLLRAAPELYRRRGTPWALAKAIELVFGVEPAITEAAPQRAWGAVGSARVRGVRVFGRGRSRVRLGGSRLGTTPVRSLGNPDLDPLFADAQRFSVLMPAGAVQKPGELDSLRRLVAAQAPAHAVGGVRVGGSGLVVGSWSAVGVDTALTPLPAPVLGGGGPGQVRLRRASVVWSRRGGRHGIASDSNALVGVTTVAR